MAIGDVVGGVIDLFSGNKASGIERRAQRKAGGILDKGYGQAIDLARPMQEQSQQDSMNLSRRYGAGEFNAPEQKAYQAGDFNYDPNSVFQDPEYNASMRAGTQSLESGAAGKGMLFSGNTGRDLQQFGQDLFAKRSDELYRRGRGEFEDDRDFGFNAANTAYDNNADARARDFTMGSSLAARAGSDLDRSIDLGMGRSQAAADTELGVGGTRANAWRAGGRKAGRIGQSAVDAGIDLGADLAGKYMTGGLY